jgi:23S rRNA (cytidine1920-2'-O)/16S rRNA (cytidine1409-2'-O)-methyltransferase
VTQAARVDAELVRRGLARSREHAVTLIADGRVSADGRPVTKPAYRVHAQSALAIAEDPSDPGYVSRAGHKLACALEAFGPAGLSARGRRCLDVGASTGGFTDVLLRAGADQVVCLDVGRDQLVASLRADPRTVVLEGRNIREVGTDDLGGPVDLAAADVSFISLLLVLPVLVEVTAPEGDLVVMVKPQFEVGRERLGSGGVVRDPQLRREAVRRVAAAAADLGWGVRGVAPSVLPGPSGNVECFLWLRQGPASVDANEIDRAVGDRPGGERVSW